ncbi:GlxA family transcriptional regulator [Aestuariirhabdus litorea]|uniref:Helix-turn-helix domain-containing protein n=1 Tax=Aestuariirhabdus litorea TaxID=2528527 RepID=A0A3P3VSR9_9GAMM|nr:helix-turn-helix domain-containing protein [Aestuariirhabdus litorea]RRJ84529.1 helix-turn-helix domain-containing protein [Aestuariirhabdus litorea]RWW97754.1 helix-turn-helix domain-containing protein [Endozoicomonadaceae bacterium GTF-13]
MPQVTVIAVPQMLGTSVSLPMEMLHAADSYRHLSHTPHSPLQIQVAAMGPESILMAGGLRILPDTTIDQVQTSDLVLVPALWRNPVPVLRHCSPLVKWLARQHRGGAVLCAAGTGVCLLAESGLLDGRPATTHWYYFDRFSERYPRVHLQRDHFITEAEGLYCAGSVNSVADLMVHIIEQFYDRDIASRVEQQFSREIRKSYDQIYYSLSDARNHPDEAIIRVQQWLQDNHAREINSEQMAAQADMSLRTFNRRFRAATGLSPRQYLLRLRIEAAKELLRHSDLDINAIAAACGFNDDAYFARSFKRQERVTPSDFRRSVRSKLFSL